MRPRAQARARARARASGCACRRRLRPDRWALRPQATPSPFCLHRPRLLPEQAAVAWCRVARRERPVQASAKWPAVARASNARAPERAPRVSEPWQPRRQHRAARGHAARQRPAFRSAAAHARRAPSPLRRPSPPAPPPPPCRPGAAFRPRICRDRAKGRCRHRCATSADPACIRGRAARACAPLARPTLRAPLERPPRALDRIRAMSMLLRGAASRHAQHRRERHCAARRAARARACSADTRRFAPRPLLVRSFRRALACPRPAGARRLPSKAAPRAASVVHAQRPLHPATRISTTYSKPPRSRARTRAQPRAAHVHGRPRIRDCRPRPPRPRSARGWRRLAPFRAPRRIRLPSPQPPAQPNATHRSCAYAARRRSRAPRAAHARPLHSLPVHVACVPHHARSSPRARDRT